MRCRGQPDDIAATGTGRCSVAVRRCATRRAPRTAACGG
ncbi:hypothetical protein CZ774_02850 [Frigoribacterium sp. JB110]|nr:hypothetical protein CZ774_02850 [Frigoribacterium sp. JB110]